MKKPMPKISGRWHKGRRQISEGHAKSPERLAFEACWITETLFYDFKIA
jgi:hypothetical protein